MVIGQRQRHRDLAVVLLAELAAILPRHPDRVLPLLGKAGVVDDPGLDRPVPLDRRQHHLAHLGQHLLVRPACPRRQNAAATDAAPPSDAGAVTAAIGSTLLRSHGIIRPVQ